MIDPKGGKFGADGATVAVGEGVSVVPEVLEVSVLLVMLGTFKDEAVAEVRLSEVSVAESLVLEDVLADFPRFTTAKATTNATILRTSILREGWYTCSSWVRRFK